MRISDWSSDVCSSDLVSTSLDANDPIGSERLPMHEIAFPLLVGLVILALAFDFLNGLHDAANSIATVVATRLLRPVQAVLFAAFFNFAAYFLSLAFPALHKVVETIGAGRIELGRAP